MIGSAWRSKRGAAVRWRLGAGPWAAVSADAGDGRDDQPSRASLNRGLDAVNHGGREYIRAYLGFPSRLNSRCASAQLPVISK